MCVPCAFPLHRALIEKQINFHMKVLNHHIYEYQKGLRNLVLHTMDASYIDQVIKKLETNKIAYIIRTVTDKKINVFFGERECIEVIERLGDQKLNEFTPEQDFILGIMLGYSRIQQCKRYLKLKDHEINQTEHLKIVV